MLVRREEPRDRDAIRSLLVASFEGGEPDLVDALRRDPAWIGALCLVAEVGGTVCGHVVGTRANVAGWPAVALGPLAVLPRFRGNGVGTALARALVRVADLRGEPLVGVLGEPAFYGRAGFVDAAALGISPEREAWRAAFSVRPLTAFVPGQRGVFRYAAPFMR